MLDTKLTQHRHVHTQIGSRCIRGLNAERKHLRVLDGNVDYLYNPGLKEDFLILAQKT